MMASQPLTLESAPLGASADRDRRRSLDRLWRLLAVAVPLILASGGEVNYIDFWWSISTGRAIIATGHIPNAQPAFFTPVEEPFLGAQWLAHALLYLVYTAGGLPSVVLLRGTIIAALAGLLLVACERLGASPRVAAGSALVGSVYTIVGTAERPQLFAILPFAAFALCLVTTRVGWRSVALLPLLMIFWVNVHGSFVLGLALVGLCWLARAWELLFSGRRFGLASVRVLWRDAELRRRTALGLLTALATLLSPLGPRAYAYAVALQGNETIRKSATEWQPLSANEAYGWMFFGALFAAAVLLKLSRARPGFVQAVTFALFTGLALSAIRNGVWWAIVATPFIAWLITGALPTRSPRPAKPRPAGARGRKPLDRILMALVVVIVVVTLPYLRPLRLGSSVSDGRDVFQDKASPARVAQFLASSDVAGHVYVAANWTPYVAWYLQDRPVQFFIDNRFEIHPSEVWEEYSLLANGHASWEKLLDRYGVDWLVLDVEADKHLIPVVRESGDWREMYADAQGVVFRRGASSVSQSGQ